MRIADTSALYAAFAQLDVHHDEAREALSDPDLIIVPSEIFVETVDLVQYRIGHVEAHTTGEYLRGLPHIQIRAAPARVLQVSWQIYLEAHGKLSVADAIVVAWCRDAGALPVTFDKEIVRRAGVLRG